MKHSRRTIALNQPTGAERDALEAAGAAMEAGDQPEFKRCTDEYARLRDAREAELEAATREVVVGHHADDDEGRVSIYVNGNRLGCNFEMEEAEEVAALIRLS